MLLSPYLFSHGVSAWSLCGVRFQPRERHLFLLSHPLSKFCSDGFLLKALYGGDVFRPSCFLALLVLMAARKRGRSVALSLRSSPLPPP